jgi:hypothetical protein
LTGRLRRLPPATGPVPRRPLRRWAAGLAIVAATALPACGDTGFQRGHPLELDLTVDQVSRPVGTPHEFDVNARGRWLLAFIIDYGDGQADTVPTFGSQSAGATRSHTYDAPGSYMVRASIEDAVEGIARDSITVIVSPVP